MNGSARNLLGGALAGAAGTTALNAVTYLDMAARGRPASSTPQDTVKALADRVGVSIPGDEQTRQNRLAGLGPLTGIGAGVAVGAALGALRALGWRPGLLTGAAAAAGAAMVGANGPMALVGTTDPRTWSAKAWVSDVVPHLAYGAVTQWVAQGLDPR